jgi:hypothetical protein
MGFFFFPSFFLFSPVHSLFSFLVKRRFVGVNLAAGSEKDNRESPFEELYALSDPRR